ncbi:hypothetical protein D9619_013057 [Psilocybe cf. subviscida]|uniref:Uncharacterized protein n=1 Tax=Psilocybe cf. subviscida TaxID=2480587 RepID=A0A8H5EVI5_9AGAR|nr:hypothetical protein D9619_013057 [Psilocybe cf. subviscida]
MNSVTSFMLVKPTYTDDETRETPWNAVELKIWDTLATAIESSTIEPAALAEELNRLFPTNRLPGLGPQEPESPESFLWEFWGIFAKAAGQVPVDHAGQQRLVELLTALRDLPNPVPVPELEASWGELKLWSDLPIMGPTFREALDVDTGINLQAFIARIGGAGLAGFWFLALYSLNKALEMQLEPRSTAYDKRGELLDEAVPNAAVWIQFAGAKIYEMSVAEEMRDTTAGKGGSWKGQPGFSKKRWDSWKRKFEQLSGDIITKQETRDAAAKAKDIMDELQRT